MIARLIRWWRSWQQNPLGLSDGQRRLWLAARHDASVELSRDGSRWRRERTTRMMR